MRILVVESESRHAERAKDGLGSDGWSVDVVNSVQAAAAAAASQAPQLVIVNAELAGARELMRSFARAHGGPGAIALVPEMPNPAANAAAKEADEILTKPFQEVALRQLARRVVSSERGAKPDSEKRLTSHELFGDLLAEVENEIEVPPETSAPAPRPAPAAAAPAAPATPAMGSAMATKLEQTLSGVLSGERPRAGAAPAAAARKSDNIDDMLSRTLSGLEVGKKAARPAASAPAAPAKPAARPEPPKAAPRPPEPAKPAAAAPAPPAPATAPAAAKTEPPRPVPAPPAAVAAAAAPPVEAPKPPAAKPAPPKPAAPPALPKLEATPTPAKRQSREIDLTQLDALAKPRGKEGASGSRPGTATRSPESFVTQKIATTPSFLQPPSAEFGQYTLLERIAVGGMAEVWKARMKGVEGFQKTVAIKKILPHLTDSSDFVTMFIDEAKLAAQLNHNNIIHIYDLGKINDDYFIAMEYVDGKDLRAILNQARADNRPLPMNLALFVGSRLASALDHAHRQKDFEGRSLGLVHRDVSPQNVLISYEGDIKLCDFGIVKAVTKASKTQMGALKGKLQYMSPEQAWGRPVDARSDLFSLGSLLFEMLTGRRLFSGESEMSVLDAVREGRIQAPRDLDPRLPLEINALVLKSLARDPDDRFQTASEMQREIDSILASLKPPPSQSELGSYLSRLFESERAGAAPALAGAAFAEAASAPAAVAAASAAVPKSEISVVKPTGVSKIEEAEGGKGGKMLWIAIGGAAAAGLVAFLLLSGKKGGEPPPPAPPAEAPATDSAAPSDATAAPGETVPAGTAPAADPATAAPAPSVDQMVSAEVKKREDELKKRYEDELAKRRAEIEKLNKPAPAQTAAAPAPAPAPPAEPEPVAAEPVPAEPEPQPAPVEAAPEPVPAPVETAPAPPTVKEGDLVQRGPGVIPPVLATFNKPEYPPIARRLKVEGTVVLSMLVDETGRVIDTRLESGVSQNVGINEAALAAARSAKFTPATKNGVRVKMWYQLRIPFKL